MVAVAREKRISANAASLGFYAFDVFVALVVLIYAVFAHVGTGNVLATALEVLTGVGAATFQRLVERAGSNAAGRRRAIVLAVVISVWSSFRLFRATESVFSEIYEIRDERPVYRRVRDSAVVLVAVTLTALVMLAVGSLFVFRTAGPWAVLGPAVLWLALFVLYLPLYYTFSGGDVSVREVLPGTAVAAAGWAVSAVGLRAYVHVSESVDLYGVVGAVLLVLTWLYVVGFSVVLGVILNALLAGRIEADREWYVFEGDDGS